MNKNKTLISSLLNSNDDSNDKIFDYTEFRNSLKNVYDYELVESFNDTNNTSVHREILIEEFNKRDYLLLTECVSNLVSQYIDSNISITSIKNLLIEICNNKNIPFPLRIMAIQSFETPKENISVKDNTCFLINLYTNILEQISNENSEYHTTNQVSTTFFWDIFKKILESPEENKEDIDIILSRLINIAKIVFNNKTLNEEFRYKLLQSINKSLSINIDFKSSIFEEFLSLELSDYKYYIYTCQMLHNINKLENNHLSIVYNLTKNRELTQNAIADIADFFLGVNNDEYKLIGKQLLESVSFDGKSIKTFYNNAQNIHHIDVDKSINPFIEKLIDMNFETKVPNMEDEDAYSKFLQTFITNIENHATDFCFSDENKTRIKHAITRFILDNTLYSSFNISLLQLLIKAYLYIQVHPFKDELLKRMCEELSEMSDTCTTGHIYRLVNIFSSYDVEMTMPVEEEIKSCVFARLQKAISLKSDEEQDAIYEVIGSSDDIKKKEKKKIETLKEIKGEEEYIDEDLLMNKQEDPEIEFNRLMGKDIEKLYEELRKEYVDQGIIDVQTYITYVRKAISLFQIGEKI
jgi:hypothetical protein